MGRGYQTPEVFRSNRNWNEFLAEEQNSPRPKPRAEQGTQFLFLSCSGCASAEPYPSQNDSRLQPARSNRQAQITKHPNNSTFDL